MKQTKEILKDLGGKHKNIDYYFILIEKIEKNVLINPDISIESCKSLMEGISKYILKTLDANYNSAIVDKMDFQPLVKNSLTKLSEYNEDMELDFVCKVNKLVVSIGEVRNRRGDISHGKLAPKEYISDNLFSNLVMQMTDSLLFYILTCFSKIELQKKLKYEDDDNIDFNQWLDDTNPFVGLSYSKALFDQDIDAYKQELILYKDNKLEEDG